MSGMNVDRDLYYSTMKKSCFFTTCLSAAQLAVSTSTLTQEAGPGRILLSNSGNIYLANYTGSSFEITMTGNDSGHSASWLALSEPTSLYAVDEWSNVTRAFELDVTSDKFKMKSEEVGSNGVVHLELNKERTRMLGAAFGAGTVDVWNVASGGLSLMMTIDSDDPTGPNKERQTAPHPHQAVLDPSGRFFAINDLGTDRILLIDSADDAFEIVSRVRVEPSGAGPRHGSFYPSSAEKATHYLVLCEIMNLVIIYELSYTGSSIEFSKIQEISTFDTDVRPGDDAAASGLAVVGEHVYVSNRATGQDTDSISHFRILKCGDEIQLRFSSSVSTGGITPRMFSAGSSGAELLVGNQEGELALVAIGIREDGSLDDRFRASLNASSFGEEGFGPQFVLQVS